MPGRDLIPFPLERRAALVREIASGLASTHGEAANMLWRGLAKRLRGELEAQGHDEGAAANQVRMLFSAVHAELQQGAQAMASR